MRREIFAEFRRFIVGMVHGEFRAFPAALAKQREVVEVDAFRPALAMVQPMYAKQPHALRRSFRAVRRAARLAG